MSTATRTARVTGVLYLAMCVLGVFAHLGVRGDIRVPGDAAATAANILAEQSLFRLSLVADIAVATLFVGLGVALHRLLRHVDRNAAGALVVFVAVGAGMILINLLFQHAALLVATDPAYTATGGDDGLVLLLVDLHDHGYTIAGIFFGLWLLPLGSLVYRSGLFPRLLGIALLVAGAAWILATLASFLSPDLPSAVHAILTAPTVAEFWMIAYLLIKGVRVRRTDPSLVV